MSHSTDIFVSTDDPREDIVAVLEAGLGVHAQPASDEGTPYLLLDEAAVHVGPHDFFDFYDNDTTIPLETEYPHWIDVRSRQHDIEQQREVGQRVFDLLKQTGRWKLVYLDNFQHVVDSYDPAQPAEQAW